MNHWLSLSKQQAPVTVKVIFDKMAKTKFKIDEIALVLIVVFIATFVNIYTKAKEPDMEAEKITAMILDDHKVSFANNGVIDEAKLKEIQNISYEDFKNSLKVKNDFCIYIEDGDENVIVAKGSSKLSENSICRE